MPSLPTVVTERRLAELLRQLREELRNEFDVKLAKFTQSKAAEGNMLKSSMCISDSQQLYLDAKFTELSQESAKLQERSQENPSPITELKKSPAKSGDTGEILGENHTLHLRVEYQWQPSMWEASLFIGAGQTWWESFALSVSLLFTVFLCIFFILHCSYSLIQADFSEEAQSQFHQWQTTVAHDIAFRNQFTGESLASIVCKQKLYSPFATLQFSLVGELMHYKSGFAGTEAGKSLCLLSLTVWYLTLLTELRLMVEKIFALRTVPLGPWTEFTIQHGGEVVRLTLLSKCRLCSVLAILLVRFAILASLGVVGTLWLVHELSLEEMILNSVSLTVVLELDELIYASMLPASIKTRMNALLPITYARTENTLSNTFISVIGSLGLLGTAIMTVKLLLLDPYVVDMYKSLDALCADESSYDFVVAIDSLGIPWVAPTPTLDIGESFETYASSVVNQAILEGGLKKTGHLTPTQRDNSGRFMQVLSGSELQRVMKEVSEFKHPAAWTMISPTNIPEIHGWDEAQILSGKDFGDAKGTVYNYYLRYLLDKSDNVTCADVPDDLCYSLGSTADAIVMRKLCGVRCGCDRPNVGTVSTPHSNSKSGFTGCGAWNTRRDVFVNQLDKLHCWDTMDSTIFSSWVEGLGKSELGDVVTDAWRNGGCPEVAAVNLGIGQGAVMNLCSQTSLPAMCPESCGCNTTSEWSPAHTQTTYYCPYSCGRTLRPCITVFRVHGDQDTGPDGPLVGVACVFPFMYKGRTYSSCTTEDWSGPWCAVTLAADGAVKYWGDCPADDACMLLNSG